MPFVHNKLPSKIEDGYIEMINARKSQYLVGVTGYAGFESSELDTPRYHVIVERMEPEIIEENIVTGNWRVELTIAIVTHYKDESREQRSNRAGELFDIVLNPLSLEEINNILMDAHIYGGAQGQLGQDITPIDVTRTVEEHLFVETVRLELYARAAT